MKTNERKKQFIIAAVFVAIFEVMLLILIFNNCSFYSVATTAGQRTFWESVIIAVILSALSLWGMMDEIMSM